MKLEKLTLILENCEMITIDGKYIGEFHVDKIKSWISRIACNAIEKKDECGLFLVEIHKDANNPKNYCLGDQRFRSDESIFERLLHGNDITHIEVDLCDNYEDENGNIKREHYEYLVPWGDAYESRNSAQQSGISECGNLYIVISRKIDKGKKNLFSYFDTNYINDPEQVDSYFSMCCVGDMYSNPHRFDEVKIDDET